MCSHSAYCSALPDKYDKQIKRAALIYLPYVDWRLYKAQLYQESLLNPNAVSPVGASGLAQFMPATWREYQAAARTGADPFSAAHSITAGAWYMAKQRHIWKTPRPESDRHSLAMASYNAGAGNIIKAQSKCGGRIEYASIIKCLPDVTGHHSKETITYVQRIWRYYIVQVLGGY